MVDAPSDVTRGAVVRGRMGDKTLDLGKKEVHARTTHPRRRSSDLRAKDALTKAKAAAKNQPIDTKLVEVKAKQPATEEERIYLRMVHKYLDADGNIMPFLPKGKGSISITETLAHLEEAKEGKTKGQIESGGYHSQIAYHVEAQARLNRYKRNLPKSDPKGLVQNLRAATDEYIAAQHIIVEKVAHRENPTEADFKKLESARNDFAFKKNAYEQTRSSSSQ